MPSSDPAVVRSVAVTVEDVVTALEANVRRDAGAVLRVTPPFSGRMRARLHLADAEAGDDGSVHIDPADLAAAPPFPTPDATEDELRESDREYAPERHRALHERRVEAWREAVRANVVDSVEVETPAGSHRVAVTALGS